MNNYIEINFEELKGFNKLSKNAKKLFILIYKKQNSNFGIDEKSNWIPKKVKEYRSYLRVDFSNGEWLHYYANGTWG
ncbi:hypothetical protein [Helicovermis profundi]|uniref:Uncharacterized protein n=1 Tax=Helicovermis profundi TaxID=3065157 RepID=A0AAU9ENB6_9FIRM|nr:hypothetical protein HLPR_11220 [Clostridia bacterium S502]